MSGSQRSGRWSADGIFVATVALGTLLAVGAVKTAPWGGSIVEAQDAGEQVGMGPAEAALALGFSPDALAAGGCEASDALTLLAFLADRPEDVAALAAARGNVDTARQDLNEAEALLWRAGATEQRLAAVEQAEAQLVAAQTTYENAREALREPALEFLAERIGPEGVALCEQFQANRDRPVAEHLKALDLPADQWGLIKAAWLHVQRDQPVPPGLQTALAAAQNDPTASLVESRLSLHGPAVRQTFNQALAP